MKNENACLIAIIVLNWLKIEMKIYVQFSIFVNKL